MKAELDRKFDVVSMMITMHSILFQQFKTRAFFGNTLFLIFAILLNTAVFADFKALGFDYLSSVQITNLINICSFIILLLSIIFLTIDWSKKSASHELAVNQLSRLLSEIRKVSLIQEEDIREAKCEILNELYDQTFETLPKINNGIFNKLKAKHYYKKELSKFIDLHKGKSFFIIKVHFFFAKNIFKKPME